MSRSEEAALEAYPISTPPSYLDGHYLLRKEAYIKGYEQVEKDLAMSNPLPEDTVLFQKGVEEGRRLEKDDLALTWEDIGKIHAHLEDVFKETAKGLHDEWTVMDMYEEVSKRFNENRKK